MMTLQHQHHRRLLDEPSEQDNVPSHFDRTLSICVATVICVAIAYVFLSSVLKFVRRCRQQQRPNNTETMADAQPDPACMAQLKAIPVIVYNKTNGSSSVSSDITKPETCAVCLAEYAAGEDVRVLPRCRHSFHRKCIDQWLISRSSFCPMCRDRVIERDVEPARASCRNSVNTNVLAGAGDGGRD